MKELPEIASLWIGSSLSFLEQLCLKSFLDRGHKVTLYVYDEVQNIPEGIKIADAKEIYPQYPLRLHVKHQSPAVHADYFRVKLLLRGKGEIWADTDAYCHKPFRFENPHVYGWLDGQIANGVLRLPADSPALKAYDHFLEEAEPLPPWMAGHTLTQLDMLRKQGFVIPIEAMPWGSSGPQALTYFLKQSGEIKWAQKEEVFYPMSWQTRRLFLKMPRRFEEHVSEDTVSFHFLGRIVRRILWQEFGGLPKKGSILETLCFQHEIDPQNAPILAKNFV